MDLTIKDLEKRMTKDEIAESDLEVAKVLSLKKATEHEKGKEKEKAMVDEKCNKAIQRATESATLLSTIERKFPNIAEELMDRFATKILDKKMTLDEAVAHIIAEKGWGCLEPIKENGLNVYKYDGYTKKEQKELAKERAMKGYCGNDLFCIDWWFLEVMPCMLMEFSKQVTGYPFELIEEYYKKNKKRIGASFGEFLGADACHSCGESEKEKRLRHYTTLGDNWASKEWVRIIKRMAFLFNECKDDECTYKNKYEAEWKKAVKDNEERQANKGESGPHHLLPDLPEYKELNDNYGQECMKILAYQEECKNEAFALFSKWFIRLWN
jgi:hypothetical protein